MPRLWSSCRDASYYAWLWIFSFLSSSLLLLHLHLLLLLLLLLPPLISIAVYVNMWDKDTQERRRGKETLRQRPWPVKQTKLAVSNLSCLRLWPFELRDATPASSCDKSIQPFRSEFQLKLIKYFTALIFIFILHSRIWSWWYLTGCVNLSYFSLSLSLSLSLFSLRCYRSK